MSEPQWCRFRKTRIVCWCIWTFGAIDTIKQLTVCLRNNNFKPLVASAGGMLNVTERDIVFNSEHLCMAKHSRNILPKVWDRHAGIWNGTFVLASPVTLMFSRWIGEAGKKKQNPNEYNEIGSILDGTGPRESYFWNYFSQDEPEHQEPWRSNDITH